MTTFIRFVLRLFSLLPLAVTHFIGKCIGYTTYYLFAKTRNIVRTNIALAFPDLSHQAQNKLVRDCLLESGKTFTELGHLWLLPAHQSARLIRKVEGLDILEQAEALSKGVLIAIPHLGAWEMMNVFFGLRGPSAALYREPRKEALHAIIREGRQRAGTELIPADRSAVRKMIRAFAKQKVVGILPDQQPKKGEGVFAPFFNHPALTMTLISKLAIKLQVPVVFGAVVRLPKGQGFEIHFRSAEPDFLLDDPIDAATALNANIERFARDFPNQYQWTYKRFALQPADKPSPYNT